MCPASETLNALQSNGWLRQMRPLVRASSRHKLATRCALLYAERNQRSRGMAHQTPKAVSQNWSAADGADNVDDDHVDNEDDGVLVMLRS